MKDKGFSVSRFRLASLFLTLFRGWIGASFVGMPFGVVSSGFLSSTLCLVVLGWMSAYCASLMLYCKYKRVGLSATFSDLAEHVLGAKGVVLLDFLLMFCQTGFCMSYVIFIERNVGLAFPSVNGPFFSLALQFALVVLVLAAQTAEKLSLLATLSSVLVFVGLCLCVPAFSLNLASQVPAVTLSGIPLMLGMACSAMTGIGIVFPLESALYNQIGTHPTFGDVSLTTRIFVRALYMAVGLTTIVLVAFGIAGAFTFGFATDAVVTVNIRSGQNAFAVQMCLVVSMILAFPLQFFPVRSISEKYVFLSDEESNFMRSMWRFSLVILIGFLGSMSKADFALVYSFVGGLFGCLIAFVLPIVFFISLEKPKGNSLGFHIFLLAFSLMVVLMSSFSSGAALVKSYLLV